MISVRGEVDPLNGGSINATRKKHILVWKHIDYAVWIFKIGQTVAEIWQFTIFINVVAVDISTCKFTPGLTNLDL